jgi:hydroxymethylpyrimidine/phosphomethylpyrimidine kinase
VAGARIPRVLSIAGSDSGAGAGVQADLLVFHELGVFGLTAVTAVTAQTAERLRRWEPVSPSLVRAQIDAAFAETRPAAVKTGMLGSAGVARVAADRLRRHRPGSLVVDPVLVASAGGSLIERGAFAVLCRSLLPLATIVTPNLPEAEILTRSRIRSPRDRLAAAHAIVDAGAGAVLITGGHADGRFIVDLLYDGQNFTEYVRPRIRARNTHGTGCVLSAAVAAHLALGAPLGAAVTAAIDFVRERLVRSMRFAGRFPPGQVPRSKSED